MVRKRKVETCLVSGPWGGIRAAKNGGIILPSKLEAAVIRSGNGRTRASRNEAAKEVARLLHEGAPITDYVRSSLAKLFAGELKPLPGRIRTHREELERFRFCLRVDLLRDREGISIDKAIEKFCSSEKLPSGRTLPFTTARRWYWS